MYEGSNLPTSLSTFVTVCLFDYSHHNGVKWYFIYICIFLIANDVKYCVLISHLYIFFGEMSIHQLCSLKKLGYLSVLSCRSSLWILNIRYWLNLWLAIMFSRSVGFLHFLDSVLFHTMVCNFDVKFMYFFPWLLVLLVSYPRNCCLVQGHEDLHLRFLLRLSCIHLCM